MELNEHDCLEELLALTRRDTWESHNPTEMNELFSNTNWNLDFLDDQTSPNFLPSSSSELSNLQNYTFNGGCYPFSNDQFSPPQINTTINPPNLSVQEDYPVSNMEEEELGLLADKIHSLEAQAHCKMEHSALIQSSQVQVFQMGSCVERQSGAKKLQGQPSKNLMAERRRRKRVNDRLSMLRSIVPKISKMDRTAILGDAIDYMKELLEKISNLQQEIHEMDPPNDQPDMMSIFKDLKRNQFLVRNSHETSLKWLTKSSKHLNLVYLLQFDVERRNADTRIEICCAGKPGLLLSTVKTLETLGLEIQQCVISCFNEFAMQASCSEGMKQRGVVSPEEIKQELFRNAGYGGRCL